MNRTATCLTEPRTEPVPQLPDRTVGELAHLLFDGELRDEIHTDWRTLIAEDAFRPRHDLTPKERMALSYERLRLVNDATADPLALAYDPHRLASLHEWTGVVDSGLTTLTGIHYNLFLGSLLDHDGFQRDLTDFASLHRTGTFLCTELEHGNDAAALETTAEFDRESGGFILHTPTPGAAKFMPNTSVTGGPKTALVAARLMADGQDEGAFLFLTPLSDEAGILPGITVRELPQRMGSPVDHCLTTFDRVWLPQTAMLQSQHGRLDDNGELQSTLGNRRKRFLRSIKRVTTGKLCMSAAAVGVSRTALTLAVRHAHYRHISGPRSGQWAPLVAQRSHHGRLLEAMATTYAMTFLHRTVVSRWTEHQEADRNETERLVAIAKSWSTWQARDIIIECRERCGAQGLFTTNRLAELMADIEGTITAEGDNLVICLKAAAEMIFDHEVDLPATRALPLSERTLNDPAFLQELLGGVEEIWQTRARLALRQGKKGDPTARWNATSAPALEMVFAHAQRQAAKALLTAADRATEPQARFLLDGLGRLFQLRQLSKHTGDLLAEERMTADHVRALPQAVETVIAELAPHLMTLVDAFDIPEEALSAYPLARGAYVGDDLAVPPHTAAVTLRRFAASAPTPG
ncbi:acyl-CoA dehydrogenase family protein [Streptomyces sp. NBC_00237]|uniref:acyl-CoA dehydrogenase family protein n=1 Tax=Streptomyces sp. NBC_00237 TaxID=2975687 RepID=UPI0022501F6F|nr:acyl-CoA dehydrogenase [Streptomyces sp. NBC_00237]MCX5203256.1 acyl-CoA dehydrogenase family protein [Streptomyces sp. NBC_00237]